MTVPPRPSHATLDASALSTRTKVWAITSFVLIIATYFGFMWWLTGTPPHRIFAHSPRTNHNETHTFGDSFGVLNTFFSGCAFAALVVTLLLQRQQLRASINELNRNVDANNRLLRLQAFSEYTKRYQEIIFGFPEDINASGFVLNSSRDDYALVMRSMRAYFDLCFEEWYLHRQQLIDDSTWYVWHGGMESALSKASFRQAWDILRRDTQFGPEFESLVAALISKTKAIS